MAGEIALILFWGREESFPIIFSETPWQLILLYFHLHWNKKFTQHHERVYLRSRDARDGGRPSTLPWEIC